MITRNVKNKTLVNTETSKGFRFVYDKRMIIPEKDGIIETLPWGYQNSFNSSTISANLVFNPRNAFLKSSTCITNYCLRSTLLGAVLSTSLITLGCSRKCDISSMVCCYREAF